jgi:hypothetical protein
VTSSRRSTIGGSRLDGMVEEATVDCYNEDEQATGRRRVRPQLARGKLAEAADGRQRPRGRRSPAGSCESRGARSRSKNCAGWQTQRCDAAGLGDPPEARRRRARSSRNSMSLTHGVGATRRRARAWNGSSLTPPDRGEIDRARGCQAPNRRGALGPNHDRAGRGPPVGDEPAARSSTGDRRPSGTGLMRISSGT